MAPRSEEELLDQCIELAIRCRWAVVHFRPARLKDDRWVTALQGHKGYPDLTLARDGLVLFRELKGATGRLSPEQLDWARQISGDPHWREDPSAEGRAGWRFDVWRPADFVRLVVPVLQGRGAARVSAAWHRGGDGRDVLVVSDQPRA